MTSTPTTPAGPAVVAAARAMFKVDARGFRKPFENWPPYFQQEYLDKAEVALAAAAPIIAAAERKEFARLLRGRAALLRIAADDCFKATLRGGTDEYIATWDRHHVRYLAMIETLEEHADAISGASAPTPLGDEGGPAL